MGTIEVSIPSAFSISQSALNIPPRGTLTEVVTFTPGTTSTTNSAMVTINSNDAKSSIFQTRLNGRGLPGRLVVPASFVIHATSGGAAVMANLNVRNAGRGLLTIMWPTLTASPTAPYSVSGATKVDIQPGATLPIPITFTATTKGRAPTAPFAISVVDGLSTGARTVTLRGIGQ